MSVSFRALVVAVLSATVGWMASGVFAAPSDYVSAVKDDKPIAWWRFEDGNIKQGSVAGNEMPSKHPGRYHGKVQSSKAPKAIGGQAARFDGANGYLAVEHEKAFAINELILPTSVIVTHVNEEATFNGNVLPGTTTENFLSQLDAGIAGIVPTSGDDKFFDGNGVCVQGC